MIKKITYLLVFVLNCLVIQAQTAQGFKYQTVVRSATGTIESNKIVSIRFSILKGSENGTPVYSERHSKATNEFGILNVNIGEGEVISGVSLSTINWADDKHFLKVDLDINGGNNFQFMGTSELFSVPYAMFSEKAATALDDNDKSPTNELQNISLTDNNLNLSQNGGSVDLSPYLDNTDNQTIALSGNTLSISNGNSIVLSGAVDLDPDPTNELQNLTLNGNTLSISQGNSVNFPPNLDNDPANEIQNLSISGTQISISQGNSINIPANLDNSPTNEIQFLSIQNDSLFLSQGNGIPLSQITTTPGNDPNSPGTITNAQLSGNFTEIYKLAVDGSNDYPYGDKHQTNLFEIDSQGNFILVYSIKSPTYMIGNNSFNNPGKTFFIAKYNNSGNLIWQKNYSSTDNNDIEFRFYDVKRDNSNNLYVFGRNSGSSIVIDGQTLPAFTSFILKYSSTGNLIFIYNNFINSNSFCIDNQGNSYFITGSTQSQLFINKLSPTGQLLNTINFTNNDFNSANQCLFDSQGNYIISGYKNFPGQVRGFIQKVNFNTGNTVFEFVESEATGNRVGKKFAIDNLNNIHFFTSKSNQELKYFKLSPSGVLLIQKDGTTDMSPAPVDVIFANNNLFFSADKETNFFLEAQINNYANASGLSDVNPHCITANLNGDFLSVRSLKSLSPIHGFYLKSFNNQIYKLFMAYGPFYNNGIRYDKGIYVVR